MISLCQENILERIHEREVDTPISPNGEIASVEYAGCFPPYPRRLRLPLSAMHAVKDDWRDQGNIQSGRQAAWERNLSRMWSKHRERNVKIS